MQPGLTTSRPTAGWDLRLDTREVERLGEDGSANAAPLEYDCLLPILWVPNLQVQGTLLTARTCLGPLEDGTPSDREEFGKGTSSPHLLVFGFPPPDSFLTISPLGEVSTFNILFRTVWNLSAG